MKADALPDCCQRNNVHIKERRMEEGEENPGRIWREGVDDVGGGVISGGGSVR